MGMALDEPKEDDQIFEESGFTYIINRELYEQVKPVKIEYVETARGAGYRVSANLNKRSGCCG
jgi:iron-sulfur cluster assembly protein